MEFYDRLLLENRAWAQGMKMADPEIFGRLHQGQAPAALWISCCDSRVPAEQICNAKPGELFIHRNIANLVHEDDTNAASVLEYAIQALKVDHIIVCGHRGCGGIEAAVRGKEALQALPQVDRHLDQVKRLVAEREIELAQFTSLSEKVDHVVELNVIAQVKRLADMALVRDSWESRQAPSLHGWVYDLATGQLEDVYRHDPFAAASGIDDASWSQAATG